MTPLAWKKIFQWSKHEKEFVKRGAFSLIAGLAVHDKNANDKMFEKLFPIIIRESNDDRNYVKKAVNWSLRNIGKRNKILNKKAIETAKNILKIDSKTARWIANDAIRELTSEKVLKRFEKKT
jgi:3-methyladenine DNA glycosylase AlkD